VRTAAKKKKNYQYLGGEILKGRQCESGLADRVRKRGE